MQAKTIKEQIAGHFTIHRSEGISLLMTVQVYTVVCTLSTVQVYTKAGRKIFFVKFQLWVGGNVGSSQNKLQLSKTIFQIDKY